MFYSVYFFLIKLSNLTTSLFSFFFSFILFFGSIFFFGIFDRNYSSYQFIYFKFFNRMNLKYCVGLGLDGLSLTFILLTTLLFVLIFLTLWKYNFTYINMYCYCLLSLECFLLIVFSALDLLSFFFIRKCSYSYVFNYRILR